jgi:ELWxxDGT repeat protein
VNKTELWKSDGTDAGTELVSVINPGPGGSNPRDMINVDGALFFHATDGVNGDERWVLNLADSDSDGITDPVDGEMVDGVFVDESTIFSDNFSDQNVGGTSFGYINSRSNLNLTVEDAELSDDGLMISASGSGTASVRICDLSPPDGRVKLTDGDVIVVTCGSMEMLVREGPIELLLSNDNIIVTAPTGAIILVTEFADGEIQVENLSESNETISIIANDQETVLNPDESLHSVSIDILPADFPNYIDIERKGLLPVAILGSADFDCTMINPTEFLLEGIGVATRGKKNKPLADIKDVNDDGFGDLVIHFDAIAFTEGQTSATLVGELYPQGGDAPVVINGSDSIVIIP